MQNYSIFISSSDSYSDIWPLFFDLFKKYWPEYNGEIVLNTELLEYKRTDLDIRCTKVGKLGGFGKTFRAGLDKVDNENILLIMIDYIFMDKVHHTKLVEYFQFFKDNNLDSMCLVQQNYPNTVNTKHTELLYVLPPAPHIMFSYQIAFWKKNILKEMALPHENPWMSEWFGSQRAEKMKIKLACLKKEIQKPILYDLRGCLHQGKWLDNAVSFIQFINYRVDFENRGFYKNGYDTLLNRFRIKYWIWSSGLKGSYYDLLRRKPIYK